MSDEKFYVDLWGLITEQDMEDKLQPGEKTVEMYAKEIGLSVDAARERLRQWEKAGVVTKRILRRSSGGRLAYKPVKSPVESKNG